MNDVLRAIQSRRSVRSFKSDPVPQEILDQIMPCMVPVRVVAFIYWLLGRKKMTSTKAIILVMVLSIVLYALGILG